MHKLLILSKNADAYRRLIMMLSDVAFEAKRKGIRDALPEKCWRPPR